MKKNIELDLSFWRVVIIITFAKTWLWAKHNNLYLFHIGTFTDGVNTALSIVILPLSIKIGIRSKLATH